MLSFSALLLFLLAPALAGLGIVGVHWASCRLCPLRAARGRWLFGSMILLVGLLAVVAAGAQRQNLVLFGLLLALLFMAMLWEWPSAASA